MSICVYFGEAWASPMLRDARQVPTPVGVECWYCVTGIEEGDSGFLRTHVAKVPGGWRIEGLPIHKECDLRSIVGSSWDLKGECLHVGHCNELREAAGISIREDAIAVWDWFQKHGPRPIGWADDIDDHRSGR